MDTNSETNVTDITAGLMNRTEIAAALGCSERTICRYEHAGLPVIRLRMLRLYQPDSVREWLLSHEAKQPVIKKAA